MIGKTQFHGRLFFPLPPSHRTWLNRWFNRGRSRDSFLVFQRVECTYACTLRERERERGRGREFVEIVFPCKTGQFSFPARWPEWKSVKEQYLSFTSITAPREISNANDPSNICRLNYYTFFFFFSSPCSDRAANFYSVAFFFFLFNGFLSSMDFIYERAAGRTVLIPISRIIRAKGCEARNTNYASFERFFFSFKRDLHWKLEH